MDIFLNICEGFDPLQKLVFSVLSPLLWIALTMSVKLFMHMSRPDASLNMQS